MLQITISTVYITLVIVVKYYNSSIEFLHIFSYGIYLKVYLLLIYAYFSAYFCTSAQPPPEIRPLPCDRLIRKAWQITATEKIDDDRNKIMSVFGSILKFDSTKKV